MYDIEETIELAEEIKDLTEEIPEEGIDLACGITKSVEGIVSNIEAYGNVTDRQWDALENMKAGVEKWL